MANDGLFPSLPQNSLFPQIDTVEVETNAWTPEPESAGPELPPNPLFPEPGGSIPTNPLFPEPEGGGAPENPLFPEPEGGGIPMNPLFPEPEGGGMPMNPLFPEPGAENPGYPEPGAEIPGYPEPEGGRPPYNPLFPEPEWGITEPEWGHPEGEAEPGVYPEPPVPLFSDYTGKSVYSTLAAVAATLIIVLNIAVLVVLSRRPKQRKSLSYLVGLIATFDMLGGLQFLWFSSFDIHLMKTHQGMWIIIMCGIWMLTMAPQISAMLHFGLHLLNELQVGVNNAKFSMGRIIFIILTVFAFPIALFIPPLAGWNCIGCRTDVGPENYCAKKCSMAIFPFTKIYVLLMVALLFAAMILVGSIYIAIYSIICRKRCNRKLSPKSGNTSVLRVTTLLLVVYILCTLPVSIVMVFDFANWEYNPHIVSAFTATLFVSFLSNLVNPIIVFSTLPAMRKTTCCRGEDDRAMTAGNGAPAENGLNGNQAIDGKAPIEDGYQGTTKI